MTPKLYVTETSPPVRSVLMTAAAIGLELEKHDLDLFKGEHLTPEFIKINPQHTVPTLIDGDYILWDSHAINRYLVSKYAKNDSLYPKDLQKRGTVDSRLHYNDATIFNTLKRVGGPVFRGESDLTDEGVKAIEEIYQLLNTLLEKSEYIAGDNVTIADLCVIANMSSSEILAPIDEARFPKLTEWVAKLKQLPCYAANIPGVKKFEEMILPKLKK